MGQFAQPAVTRIFLHQGLRLPRHVVIQGTAHMANMDFRTFRQQGSSERTAERVLFLTQVADDTDFEVPF